MDIEATNWLMNEGYKSRAFNLHPKPKKKRREEFKVCDFVDTRKVIDGSSSEEDPMKKARSKAAREELESEDPTEMNKSRETRGNKRRGRKPKTPKDEEIIHDQEDEDEFKVRHKMPSDLIRKTENDDILDEINHYQQKSKKNKRGRKKKQKEKEDAEDQKMEDDLERELGEEQRLDELMD